MAHLSGEVQMSVVFQVFSSRFDVTVDDAACTYQRLLTDTSSQTQLNTQPLITRHFVISNYKVTSPLEADPVRILSPRDFQTLVGLLVRLW